MQVSSVQARYGESPARHGEIIGPDLNQLAAASRSSPWRVSSAQNPASHECSPATRYGEENEQPARSFSFIANPNATVLLHHKTQSPPVSFSRRSPIAVVLLQPSFPIAKPAFCSSSISIFLFASSTTLLSLTFIRTNCSDDDGNPVGEAGGLLSGYIGFLASSDELLPIMYPKWPKVPLAKKDLIYDNNIKAKFVVSDTNKFHKKWIYTSLGKRWRERRCFLFNKFYDWALTVEQNIEQFPPEVTKDHWAMYLNYRLSPDTMQFPPEVTKDHWAMYLNYRLSPDTMAKADKNALNRQKQRIPHTLGTRSLARTKDIMEQRDGRSYSRGDMYEISHKRRNGSYGSNIGSPFEVRRSSESSHNVEESLPPSLPLSLPLRFNLKLLCTSASLPEYPPPPLLGWRSWKREWKDCRSYSVQARSGESPACYGEIIGPDLNQLAVASSSSPWRVSSAQNPARHEYSLITRWGEFMQKCPVL
ncbi:hypothetical protein QL285_038814 [Trifolium repens]|nr:hypothetical protein QL285_038814 [Trifolium repens]